MKRKANVICQGLIVVLFCAVVLHAGNATRIISDLEKTPWKMSQWNKAVGSFSSAKECAAGSEKGASIKISVNYSGNGFEHLNVYPVTGVVPGRCRKVSLWAKGSAPKYSWKLTFKDAEGRKKVNGKKLEATIKAIDGEWTKTEFSIPADWAQPITLSGITAHNWNKKNEKAEVSIIVSDIKIETDVSAISDVNELLSFQVETDTERNIFTSDAPVLYRLVMDSWRSTVTEGKLTYIIKDASDQTVAAKEIDISFQDTHTELIKFKPEKYGVYRIIINLPLNAGNGFNEESRFSYIPVPHKYTFEEKMQSPYGINIHGGVPGVAYKDIARIGYSWIRDYAYNVDWIKRARGDNGKYEGWPWYQKMNKKVEEAGLMLLPCFMGWIKTGVANGDLEPTKQFKIDILQFMMTFPQYVAWEADNEYDLHKREEKEAREWSSYRAYHNVFGETVKFLEKKSLAVEQGCAGVHPERTRRNIKSGSFDNIDVVNAHFYCGTSAPELSLRNANTGGDKDDMLLVYDNLREIVDAADSDGKDRQVWITEFGWDTLAGHVVSEYEQAAYLQRCYLLGLHAGIDKMFWYWNRDTKKPPSHFFDGCGIFDPKDEPKPASAAMAALVHFLKLPEIVGTFDVGPNSLGYVIKDRDRYVACMFKVDKDKAGPLLSLKKNRLFDMYGNLLTSSRFDLDLAPVWIMGVKKTDPVYRATAFDLTSRRFDKVTAGDTYTIKLRTKHNRGSGPMPITALFRVESPGGCKIDPPMREIFVAPGATDIIPINVTIDPDEPAGEKTIIVRVQEGKNTKELSTKLRIVTAAHLTVEPLSGDQGKTTLRAKVRNNSSRMQDFIIDTESPSGWSISPKSLTVTGIVALGECNVEFDVDWNTNWKAGESAKLMVKTSDGRVIAEDGIIPPVISIPQVSELEYDGDLGDWPDDARLPTWAIGDTDRIPGTELYVGHSTNGLHFAFRIAGSDVRVTDPKWFWAQDCVEIFVDSRNDKEDRKSMAKTDHQFWFCPLVEEKNRVYAGRWKNSGAIDKTIYDMKGIRGFAGKTDDGYVMEFLLPESSISEISLKKGEKVGVAVVVTVPSEISKRQIFWPMSKKNNIQTKPALWGTMVLE